MELGRPSLCQVGLEACVRTPIVYTSGKNVHLWCDEIGGVLEINDIILALSIFEINKHSIKILLIYVFCRL